MENHGVNQWGSWQSRIWSWNPTQELVTKPGRSQVTAQPTTRPQGSKCSVPRSLLVPTCASFVTDRSTRTASDSSQKPASLVPLGAHQLVQRTTPRLAVAMGSWCPNECADFRGILKTMTRRAHIVESPPKPTRHWMMLETTLVNSGTKLNDKAKKFPETFVPGVLRCGVGGHVPFGALHL